MTGTQRQLNEHKQQNHREDHRLEVHLVAHQIQTPDQILGNVTFAMVRHNTIWIRSLRLIPIPLMLYF